MPRPLEDNSSDSSEPLIDKFKGRNYNGYGTNNGSEKRSKRRNLLEESDWVLAGFTSHKHFAVSASKTVLTTMESSQQYLHIPRVVEPLDGAKPFPSNLDKLLLEYCGREKTKKLPCARALGSWAGKAKNKRFRFEHISNGGRLDDSYYKYGSHDHLLVVAGRGLPEPAIINYVSGSVGETSSRKMYSVWKGIPGWEKTPSVVKMTASWEENLMSQVAGVSQRPAGKQAEERIRLLSLKRGRADFEAEIDDDSGSIVTFLTVY